MTRRALRGLEEQPLELICELHELMLELVRSEALRRGVVTHELACHAKGDRDEPALDDLRDAVLLCHAAHHRGEAREARFALRAIGQLHDPERERQGVTNAVAVVARRATAP